MGHDGLAGLRLPIGKQARLHRMLHGHELRNGRALFLPYDQGLEHGPRDFADSPWAADPAYVMKLAVERGFNGWPCRWAWRSGSTGITRASPAGALAERKDRAAAGR